MIRILQKPHFECALERVKICRAFKNIQKDSLYHLFRFAFITQYANGDGKNQAVITVEEYGQGIVIAGDQAHHQVIITEIIQLFPSQHVFVWRQITHESSKLLAQNIREFRVLGSEST